MIKKGTAVRAVSFLGGESLITHVSKEEIPITIDRGNDTDE